MTVYSLNKLPVTNYQTQAKIVASANTSDETSATSDLTERTTNTNFVVENNDSFVQSVLQSFQNLGISDINDITISAGANQSLPDDINQALQTFLQDLYRAVSPKNIPTAPTTLVEPDSPLFSGGTNFKYTVDLSNAALGDHFSDVKASIRTALDNIGQYLSSNIVFNLQVLTENTDNNTLAEANSTMITAKTHNQESIDTSFVSDNLYGSELSPSSPDANLYINLARIGEMSFNGEATTPDKFDLTSILTHEILHGIAFSGTTGNSSTTLKTGYDELISMNSDGMPEFVGRNARAANGGNPVPLAPETSGVGSAYYHVANSSDLMSESIKKGEIKTISSLDVAMLSDMGFNTMKPLNMPSSSQPQNPYNNSTANLQNLIGSISQHNQLQTDFDNLVKSLNSGASSNATLQDFLAQLANNTQQNSVQLENGLGSLLSVTA